MNELYPKMKAFFIIPGRLPGMNEIIKAARGNSGWYASASQKKKYTRLCANAIVAAGVPTFKNPVRILFRWYEPNGRRDVDNIQAGGAKFICDALVQTLRIPNDSRKWVPETMNQHPEPDPVNPRIEVTLEEI